MTIVIPGEIAAILFLLAFWGGWEAVPLLGALARRLIRGRYHG